MKKYIGNRSFYKMVLTIAIPIMIQNGVTNFVGLLDNIMVGQIGTNQMTGVSIVNQLMFVFNVCIFGAISGAGIFGAQFFGCGNLEGVRNAFRFKYILSGFMCLIAFILFIFYNDQLISLYLHGTNNSSNLKLALDFGKKYLSVMLIGLIPFSIVQVYSSTLRECGKTFAPMVSGIIAVLANLILNYIFIFGKFGFPAFGVIGAGIATVISRFIEMLVLVIWTHKDKTSNPFVIGLYHTFLIPKNLVKKILIKGSPLILNEAMWASGMAVLTQCYSFRGLHVVAALNISSTLSNVFNIVFLALGSSIAIIIGQLLGAGKMKEAKDTAGKLIFFSVACCVFLGFILAFFATSFPRIYNTSSDIKTLATKFILVAALCMPLNAFMHASYFTLRSGGNTIITFLFDSVFIWVVSIPLAFSLTHYTLIPIVTLYLFCQLIEIIKCIIGFVLIKKGVWLNKFVS